MDLQEKLLYELGEEYIKEKGKMWMKVVSPSMMPLIHIGDKVLVKSIECEAVSTGDIIIFKGNDIPFITHRIIRKRKINGELHFFEKGDKNVSGTWIHKKSIIARVIAIKKRDNSVIMLNETKRMRIINKLFTVYQLNAYIFERIIKVFKDWVKGYKALNFLREPYRYSYKIITRGQNLCKKLLVLILIKGMRLYG